MIILIFISFAPAFHAFAILSSVIPPTIILRVGRGGGEDDCTVQRIHRIWQDMAELQY